jgi:hypothetical protein
MTASRINSFERRTNWPESIIWAGSRKEKSLRMPRKENYIISMSGNRKFWLKSGSFIASFSIKNTKTKMLHKRGIS